jgi:hypothetical protein
MIRAVLLGATAVAFFSGVTLTQEVEDDVPESLIKASTTYNAENLPLEVAISLVHVGVTAGVASGTWLGLKRVIR